MVDAALRLLAATLAGGAVSAGAAGREGLRQRCVTASVGLVELVLRAMMFSLVRELPVGKVSYVVPKARRAANRRRCVAVVAKMGLVPRAIFNRVLAITMDRDSLEAAMDEVALHP
jgi:hypothetical protein